MTAIPARHGVGRRSRTGLLLAWALATLGGVLVAVTTRIGPVVLAITTNHGVHAGDLVGFGVCYGTVLLGTLLRPSPAQPDRTNGALAQPRWTNGTPAQRGGAGHYDEGPTRPIRIDEDATRPLRLADARRPADPAPRWRA